MWNLTVANGRPSPPLSPSDYPPVSLAEIRKKKQEQPVKKKKKVKVRKKKDYSRTMREREKEQWGSAVVASKPSRRRQQAIRSGCESPWPQGMYACMHASMYGYR